MMSFIKQIRPFLHRRVYFKIKIKTKIKYHSCLRKCKKGILENLKFLKPLKSYRILKYSRRKKPLKVDKII